MAKKTAKRNKKTIKSTEPTPAKATPAKVTPSNGTATVAGTPDSLEKVRDILFGNQQRDNDRRFSILEEQLQADFQQMREDFRARLDSLEQYAKAEHANLLDRLKAEQQRSTQAVKDLTAQHKEDLKNLDRSHTDAMRQMDKSHGDTMKELDRQQKASDDASEKRDAQIRQELLDQSSNLRDELASHRTEIVDMVNRVASDLRDAKADRALIAELFSDMALRLSGDGE